MLSEIFKLFWKTVERKDARRINSQTPPTEIEQFCDIQYIDDGLWQHRLDVYSKSGKLSHRPVIIDIHGGGWMYGTKEINKNYGITIVLITHYMDEAAEADRIMLLSILITD